MLDTFTESHLPDEGGYDCCQNGVAAGTLSCDRLVGGVQPDLLQVVIEQRDPAGQLARLVAHGLDVVVRWGHTFQGTGTGRL
jgi:hypothetical protein